MENYYPGDDYIDWLGVNVYSLHESDEDYMEFLKILDNVYTTLRNLSNKPIAILEFLITEINLNKDLKKYYYCKSRKIKDNKLAL